MKGKFAKIFGVVATLALLMGMFVAVAPVAAAPGENEFDEINLPDGGADTDIGVMAIAPDGTMFAAIYDEDDNTWSIQKSIDGGFTWEATTLVDLPDDGDFDWGEVGDQTPVDIVLSPNWPTNKTVYVGIVNGDVYRLPDAGDDEPVLLIPIVDSDGVDLKFQEGLLYDLDIFWDGSNNWLAAACDLDVLIFRDALFESWRDMEMATETDSEDWAWAVQVDFAPDFDTSNVLWAIALFPDGDELILSSTVSPGQWGNLIAETYFENVGGDLVWWTPFVDVAFPDDYDSDNPYFYVSIAEDDFDDEGNLFLINADFVPGMTVAQPLFDPDVDLGSVEVSGSVILVKEWGTGVVHRSLDNGGTFDEAERSPADGGLYWGHLYMAPGPFDPDSGVCYSTGLDFGILETSGLARTTNGGYTFHHISWIDVDIAFIEGLAFDPITGSQPAFMLTENGTEGLWYTADITADPVQWIRIGTGDSLGFDDMEQIAYAADGSAVFLFTWFDGNKEIWKSTDGGDTWNAWRDVPSSSGWVNDFVATNGTTIYAATNEGFWGTAAFGPANIIDFDGPAGVCVAVMGEMVAVGSDDGSVFLSDDGGETFDEIATDGSGDTFVAWGPDGVLYAVTANSTVQMLDDDEFVDVEDSNDMVPDVDSFSGVWVSPDNALYAMGGEEAEETSTTTLEIWGMLELDNDGGGGSASGDALCIEYGGVITLTGDTSANVAAGASVNEPVVITTSGGTWTGSENLTITSETLTAITDSIVAGRIYISGDSSGELGYFDMVWTGLSGFTEGEGITTSADNIDIDNSDDDPMVAVMGKEITIFNGSFADGDSPLPHDSTVLAVHPVVPTVIEGSVYVQGDTVLDIASFDMTWIAEFGFGADDLGDYVDVVAPAIDTMFEIVEVETVDVVAGATTDLYRLLIGETGDAFVWETANIDDAMGLWGTSGSNFLWTIVNGDELWALEDTMSGPITLTAPADGTRVAGYTKATLAWQEMTGADMYAYAYDSMGGTTSKTTVDLTGLSDNTEYDWMVRGSAPWTSRWSSEWSFITADDIDTPVNMVPVNGMQDAPLMPSFMWSDVSGATSYTFELSTDPTFATGVTSVSVTVNAYTWAGDDLLTDQDYYWRVRAFNSSTGGVSGWCLSNFHTRVAPTDPVVVTQTTTNITLTQQPAETPATPGYIWIIIVIGAILTIAVIVLIVRTRRVV